MSDEGKKQEAKSGDFASPERGAAAAPSERQEARTGGVNKTLSGDFASLERGAAAAPSERQEARTGGVNKTLSGDFASPERSAAAAPSERQEARTGGVRKVLVTGAGGFIGRNLCPMLQEQGWYVRRVVRRPQDPEAVELKDMGADTDWNDILQGMDAVVHLAARVHVLREQANEPRERFRQVNVDATRRLAEQAASAGVKRFVFISTIGVHGVKTNGEGFKESDPPHPLNDYALSKLQAEDALRKVAEETGLEVVVIRPPLVYGPGVKANFLMLLRVVKQGLPLPLASIKNKRDMIYVGNLSHAIGACLVHPQAAGETFLVDDGDTVSTPDLIRRIARAMHRPTRLLPCPESLLRLGGRILGRSDMVHRLVSSLEVDSTHIRNTVDWIPPFTFDEGLMATVEWFRREHCK